MKKDRDSMNHVKMYEDFLNEEEKQYTYDELLKKAEAKSTFKPGDEVTLKPGVWIEYKFGKPRERWKEFNSRSSKGNEMDMRVVKVLPDTYYTEEQRNIRYLCEPIPTENSEGHKVWPSISPDQGWRNLNTAEGTQIVTHQHSLIERGASARVAKIFPHIVKALMKKLNLTIKKYTLKDEKSYSANTVTISFYKVASEGLSRRFVVPRDHKQKSYHETNIIVGLFATKESAEAYVSTMNSFLQSEKSMTFGQLRNGKEKAKVKVSEYTEDIEYSEEAILEMCEKNGIDVKQIAHEARGEVTAKDLGVI